MRTRVTLQLVDEARRFALVWTCDDCVYFQVQPALCTHGYPEIHRSASALRPDDTVAFCKDFEPS